MAKRRYTVWALVVVAIAAACVGVLLFANSSDEAADRPQQSTKPQTSTQRDTQDPRQSETPAFDKTAYSTSDPASIWVVVNKRRPLQPPTYTPDDLVVPNVRLRVPGHETMRLRAEAARALEQMFAAAAQDGVPLMLSSAFRSYDYQSSLYNSYVNRFGRAAADRESARPGHSEHQTGLAADVRPTNGQCELAQCFGDMAEGKWVAANAARFGFIIRYSPTNEQEAGYAYEPWHIRYVGTALAAEYVRRDATSLEAFFGLDIAPDYN